jgi:hypothetical protein
VDHSNPILHPGLSYTANEAQTKNVGSYQLDGASRALRWMVSIMVLEDDVVLLAFIWLLSLPT